MATNAWNPTVEMLAHVAATGAVAMGEAVDVGEVVDDEVSEELWLTVGVGVCCPWSGELQATTVAPIRNTPTPTRIAVAFLVMIPG